MRPVYDLVLKTEARRNDSNDDMTFHASPNLIALRGMIRIFNTEMDNWEAYWIPVFTKGKPASPA